MIEVNAMGQPCPAPLIMTKKAIKENFAADNITVKVDNEIAVQNLTKMASHLGIKSEISKIKDGEFSVLFNIKDDSKCNIIDDVESFKIDDYGYAVIISSDKMGLGSDELGSKLMEGFVYALTEQDSLPQIIVLYNSGVNLAVKNEKTISDFQKLKEQGCEVLSCGTCLDFYGLKDSLKVGEVTNMYRIAEIMRTKKVVRP